MSVYVYGIGKPDFRRQLRELKEVVKAQIRSTNYDFSALTVDTTTLRHDDHDKTQDTQG